ncbi:sucrase ferredoxin [Angustibacter aerolatus]
MSDRCSDGGRERRDPLAATAAPARRWVLIEHPGPWAVDALAGSGIDHEVQHALRRAAGDAAARILLVRRPGRPVRGLDRTWAVLDHDAGTQVRGRWSDDHDLLAAAEALQGNGSDAEPADPWLLVCAHGRHDVCCAVRGRPVAAALAVHWPAFTWECSHVGGDRFAANLLVLPDGTTYGYLDPEVGVDVVRTHLDGGVDVERLRGPSTEPPVVQAAVVEVLRRFGGGPRSVRGTGVRQVGPDRWQVGLAGTAPVPARLDVVVDRSWRPAAHLTCRATNEARAGTFTASVQLPTT